ncbi:MAG: long-chain fatty acid--CoA ligase [Sandaracinaceae bacterium]
MVDPARYLEPRIAPRAIFDTLSERATRVRYMVPDGHGDYRAVTWKAHAEQIRRVALYLGSELKMGERAAIFAPNRVEWMAAALGIEAAGGVMVPIYASSTADSAGYILEHGDVRVVFVDTVELLARLIEAWPQLEGVRRIVLLDDALDASAARERAEDERKKTGATTKLPSYADVERRLITFSRVLAAGAARDREEPGAFEHTMNSVSLEQPGVMLYTSGTSGRPKGVPLTHENVAVNGADWLRCNAPLVEEGDVDLLWLPFSHIFGFGEACIGNTLGWTSYLSDPRTVVSELPTVRPQVFMSVPSIWEKLATWAAEPETRAAQNAKLKELTGGNLRFCLSGGAGLKREVKERFHAAGLLIVEGYGLTEASPTLTLNRPDAFRFDSVGKPLPSVELMLAEDGEILARGKSIFRGYHKDPEATREAFTEDGWLKTGDIGRWTDDGFLRIVDRKKDIFVTAGGKNVAPANIEIRWKDDPFIAHVIAFGDGQKYVTAAVWLNDAVVAEHLEQKGVGPGARTEAIRALVQTRVDAGNAGLASYETIKKFTIIDEPLSVEGGMLTPTLKPKRKAILERWGDRLEALYAEAKTAPAAERARH